MADTNPFLQESEKTGKDVFTDFLQTIVLGLAFSLIMYLVFLVPSIVDGSSMEPNYYNGELLFANKTIQWLGNTDFAQNRGYDYKRGDVVIFAHADDKLIKRVIAVEGDTVRISGGQVYVNGKLLQEDYIPETINTYMPAGTRALMGENETVRVPTEHYFLMGDNRNVSKDSRFGEVGFVPRSDLQGKVFIRYWPITRFNLIGTGSYQEINNEQIQ